MSNKTGHLFVWRTTVKSSFGLAGSTDEWEQYFERYGDLYRAYHERCPFCSSTYSNRRQEDNMQHSSDSQCQLCGFSHGVFEGMSAYSSWHQESISILKTLDLNDSELGLDELGSHLQRRFRDVYGLTPRRFEQLIEDVFRNLDYRTHLTRQARDGGFDILLEASSGRQILVECKRYSKHRRVGVGIVREVLGVQLAEGVNRAKVVTTAYFTTPAKRLAARSGKRLGGHWVELVDADALVRALGVYNTELPPLHLVDLWSGNQNRCE